MGAARETAIHKKPDAGEIAACRPWLDVEIQLVKPRAAVARRNGSSAICARWRARYHRKVGQVGLVGLVSQVGDARTVRGGYQPGQPGLAGQPDSSITMSSSSLAPSLLLSMPQLVDPNFNRTVVLLCQHTERGAFGLVVNRPLITSGPVVVEVRAEGGAAEPRSVQSSEAELQVWVGGPVEPERSWILVGHDDDAVEEAHGVLIANGLYLSTSPELLQRLLGPEPPGRTRLIVGYAGWGPGQLDAEIQESAWLISDVDRELIFNTPSDRLWEAAIRRIGADPASLQVSRGVH